MSMFHCTALFGMAYTKAQNTSKTVTEDWHRDVRMRSVGVATCRVFCACVASARDKMAWLSLLSKFESQDKNTREMVQSIKAVQQMSQRQAEADGGGLEKKVGKAVIGIGQIIAPWPLKFITSGYDLLTGLTSWKNW